MKTLRTARFMSKTNFLLLLLLALCGTLTVVKILLYINASNVTSCSPQSSTVTQIPEDIYKWYQARDSNFTAKPSDIVFTVLRLDEKGEKSLTYITLDGAYKGIGTADDCGLIWMQPDDDDKFIVEKFGKEN